MTIRLIESNAKVSLSGTKARIRLISEGVGSSGTYPANVLERDGATAFPAGTQIFFDHLTEGEAWDRGGQHSVKDLVGVTLTDAEYDSTERALYSDARFFESAAPFIADAMDFIGVSIEADGVKVDGVVEGLLPSPLNALAIVPRAGRDGKITSLIESYRESHDKISTDENTSHEPGKDKGMKPEEIQALTEALTKAVTESVSGAVTGLAESLKEALKPAPAAEVEEDAAPDVAAVAEALVAADLPETARKRVYEALNADPKADVTKVIEGEKAYVAEIRGSVATGVGRIHEGATKTDDFTISDWK